MKKVICILLFLQLCLVLPVYSERITLISLVPSQTELIFSLGLKDNLVGVTDYCNFPKEALELKKIGSFELNVERILTLKPDYLIDLNKMNGKYKSLFEQIGLDYRNFTIDNLNDVPEVAIGIAKLVNQKQTGKEFAQRWNKEISTIKVKQPEEEISVYFEIWNSPMQTVSKNSLINQMISLAHGTNIIQYETEYPIINTEVILAADPDVIFLSYPVKDLSEVASRPGWNLLSAVKNDRVFLLDQDIFVRPGPRMIKAIKELNRIINSVADGLQQGVQCNEG